MKVDLPGKSKLGVSQCPGKNIRGRDGKTYQRNVRKDCFHISKQGVTMIVCLLMDLELRHVGADVKAYANSCQKLGINLVKQPIVEGSPPEDLEKWSEVVNSIVAHIVNDRGHVLLHCRGGIGRAGTLACNVLSSVADFANSKEVIDFVRARRDKRCVESMKQADFVAKYHQFING